MVRCYVWSTALYGSETWPQTKLEQKYFKSFEMWCRRKIEEMKWSEKITNEQILERKTEKRTFLNNILHRKHNWTDHIMRRNLSSSCCH